MLTVIRPYMTAAMVVRGLRISSHVAPSFNSFRSKTRPLATLFISFPPPTAGGVRRMSSSVRATPYHQQVNDSGSIDSPLMQSMHNKIKEQLNADVVVVEDANGDGRHVRINVVSTAFEGQSAVNRQRMVYKAISEELQSVVHAVDQMITKTPAEAEENR